MKYNLRAKHFSVTVVCLILAAAFCNLCVNENTYAAAKDSIAEKAGLYGLSQCYEASPSAFKHEMPLASFNSYTSIVQNASSYTASLPNGFYGISTADCRTLLTGSGSYAGVLGSNKPNKANAAEVDAYLKGMGYQSNSNGGGICTKFYYNTSSSDRSRVWTEICADDITGSGENAVINTSRLRVETSSAGSGSGSNGAVQFQEGTGYIQLDCNTANPLSYGSCGEATTEHGDCSKTGRCTFTKGVTKWSDFVSSIRYALNDASGVANPITTWGTTYTFDTNIDTYQSSDYTLSDNSRVNSIHAIQYLSDYAGPGNLALSESEKAVLAQWYLENYYKVDSRGCFGDEGLTEDEISTAENSGYQRARVYVKEDGIYRVCLVKPTQHANDEVNYYNPSTGYFDGTKANFAKVAEDLRGMTISALDNDDISDSLSGVPTRPGNSTDVNTPSGDPDSSINSGSGDGLAACYENAGALGWIVCPVFSAAGGVTQALYGYIEDNFLQVGPSLSDNSSVREGWSIFRDFTNIIFIIAFLVVIFSQITGIGVSNYGIKKILPRLIMIVVLVNISFLLCQLAIDLSNIAGAGLNALFQDLAADIAGDAAFSFSDVLESILSAAVGVGAFVAITTVVSITIPWDIWLFPLFLTVIGCLVSVFFFLILLGVRQAGVILLMVLSPVAIICYALPNTKAFFDRWRKLFTSLLLVYPICGVMMGGGQFASTLLLKTGGSGDAGAIFTIVALLIAVVPFFFIPSILRASMTAMGNLGMRIAQFGRGIGGGITRGIRNSEIGRDVQRRANMHYFDRAAQKLEKRAKHLGGINKLSKRQRARLGRYNASYNRLGFEELRAGGVDARIKQGTPLYESMAENARSEQFDKDVSGRQNLIKNGGFKSIISPTGNVNGNDDAALSTELDEYLKRIVNAQTLGYNDDQVDEYVKSAQAIINTLSDRGTSGARSKVMNSISQAMSSNATALTGASGEELKRLTRTFGSLASRISGKYGKPYKSDNPEWAAMLGDIAKGNFSAASTFKMAKDFDIDGNVTGRHLRSTMYSGSGLDGINTEDFSKLKTSGLSNILAGIQEGDITGEKLQEVARLSNESNGMKSSG